VDVVAADVAVAQQVPVAQAEQQEAVDQVAVAVDQAVAAVARVVAPVAAGQVVAEAAQADQVAVAQVVAAAAGRAQQDAKLFELKDNTLLKPHSWGFNDKNKIFAR